MAHLEEHSTLTTSYPAYEAGNDWRSNSTCGMTWATRYTNVNYATTELRGRAASVHTTKVGRWRPPTPYWGYRFKMSDSVPVLATKPIILNGTSNVYGNTYRLWVQTSLPMSESTFKLYRPLFPDLQALAVQQALAALGSATAELGVELKEARKTAGFIQGTLEDLVEVARAVKSGRVPRHIKKVWRKWKGPKAPTFLANKWLEYRYAWTPMVLGVYDAMELLDRQKAERILFTVRKRQVEDLTVVGAEVPTMHGGYYPLPVWSKTISGQIKSVYVVLTFEARSDLCATLNDAGVINPASVLWETIPFSFVVDWFADVGGYFNAQAALRLFRLKGGTATHAQTWQSGKSLRSRDMSTGKHCLPFDGVTAMAGGTSFNRVLVDPDDLSATIVAGSGLDFKRSADTVSLLYGLLKGMLREKTGLRL